MAVLVIGSIALDTISTPFGKKENILGGSATYFSIAASYFTPVRLVAVVGSDFPKRFIALFNKYGIDTRGLEIQKGKTFRWKGAYEYDMNVAKTLATHLNVFSNFDPSLPRLYRNARYIFLANIDPDLQYKVIKQVKSPYFIACDTMNYWIEHKRPSLRKLLRNVNLFLANDAEIREFANEANLLKAARFILNLGPKMVVIKKGEHGCLFVSSDTFFSIPGFPLEEVKDPTGAGDTFAGGLMGYISCFKKIDSFIVKKGITYGSVMASYNVEKFGVDGILSLDKRLIAKRYREFKELTRF